MSILYDLMLSRLNVLNSACNTNLRGIMCVVNCSFLAILFNLSLKLELYIIFEASLMSDKHFVDDSNAIMSYLSPFGRIRF